MGSPHPSRIAASMSSRDAYRVSYIDTAWLRYPNSSALAMNPALSPTTTGCLPSCRASSTTSLTTPSSVTTVRITSTNDSTGAGLKKCSPTTRRGLAVATAISVTDSEEVLVASTVSGPTMRSRAAKMSFLRSRCSGTASTTRPQPATASSDVAYRTRACTAAASSGVSFPRSTALAVECSSASRPRARARLVDLDRDDVQPGPGHYLDDAGAHRPQSDDAHPGEVPSRSVDHVGKGDSRGYRWVGMADATVVTLVPAVDWTRRAGSETMGYVPRAGLRPPRVFRQRRRVAVLTQQGWTQDPGPDDGGGLAGVREPGAPARSRRASWPRSRSPRTRTPADRSGRGPREVSERSGELRGVT